MTAEEIWALYRAKTLRGRPLKSDHWLAPLGSLIKRGLHPYIKPGLDESTKSLMGVAPERREAIRDLRRQSIAREAQRYGRRSGAQRRTDRTELCECWLKRYKESTGIGAARPSGTEVAKYIVNADYAGSSNADQKKKQKAIRQQLVRAGLAT